MDALVKPKREVKRLLKSRIKSWGILREKPQPDLNQDVLIKIINAIHIATRRGQKVTHVILAAETESQPMQDSHYMRRSYAAFDYVKPIVEREGYIIQQGFVYDNLNGKQVTIHKAIVSRLSRVDPKGIRLRHWKERLERAKREGGPRPRKKKKRKVRKRR